MDGMKPGSKSLSKPESKPRRKAVIERKTRETEIRLTLDLDGGLTSAGAAAGNDALDRGGESGATAAGGASAGAADSTGAALTGAASDGPRVDTGVGFLDHMLTAFARHGFFGLEVRAKGDLQVDYHHLVEDVGLCLGAAIDEALGGREGLARYGSSLLPFDDALALAAVDLATRPYLALDVPLSTERVGEFEVGLLSEFWRAVTSNGRFTLHLRRLAGENPHHVLEALFKAAGRALAEASRPDPRVEGAHSTKGIL